ncbi:formyl transferase [Rhizobium sp. TH2]|nr:formyl transferase [Rhizobium sp. TH2]
MINALGAAFGPIDVVMERPEPMWSFLKRRARKVGWTNLAGQFLTIKLIVQMKRLSRRSTRQIIRDEGLHVEIGAQHRICKIESVNSMDFIEAVDDLRPEVVFLCGCRIVKPDILARVRVPMLNYHAGITPQYRGMNGGYWALANGDDTNFGATVHHVDTGVDTGAVIAQVRSSPGKGDTIWTYPLRQAAMSRAMCVDSVRAALEGGVKPIETSGPSVQHYHPEIWNYLRVGIAKGVW